MKIKIGVAIPAFSRPEMLAKLIQSIPTEWLIFISDNESSLKGKLPKVDREYKISGVKNKINIFENWNRAIGLVDNDCTHIIVPSDDDLYNANAKEVVDEYLGNNRDIDIFIFGHDYIDEFGGVSKGYCPPRLIKHEKPYGIKVFKHHVSARMPSVIIRKDFLHEIGLFNEMFTLTAADSELIQRALIKGNSLFIPKKISYYRVWESSLTSQTQATDHWINETKAWTKMICDLLKEDDAHSLLGINLSSLQNTIQAENIISATNRLLAKGKDKDAINFFNNNKVTGKLNIKTRYKYLRLCLRLRGYK